MRKSLVSMLLCLCAMRLAVVAGAEDGIRNWVGELERELMAEKTQAAAAESIQEIEEVGNVDVVPVAIYRGGGETALNLGEESGAEVLEKSFVSDLSIKNDSSRTVNVLELLSQGTGLILSADGPQILIVHTHGSEAYTQSGSDLYVESDPYRTEDMSQNVIRVGDVLTEVLEGKGLSVIHDREIYDYPSYTGSYSRSGAAVENYLSEYPSIKMVIDLHRDALGSGNTVYKTRAEASLGDCAQLMLLVGTGDNGLYHPNWQENLKLALYLQNAMEKAYPSLARPLSLKSERYNQHLCTGSLIIEVGSTGNTLAEAIRAIELFGDAAGDALVKLIDD